MENFGSDYIRWKDWDEMNFGYLPKNLAALYNAELRRTKRKDYRDVLDVGFGSGSFLRYAKNMGWNVSGVEVNPHLISAAQKEGYATFPSIEQVPNQSQDLIVAFDLLEHIDESNFPIFVRLLTQKLRLDGILLTRFPNGDSCLGLPWQNGDVTHRSFIGSGKIEFVAKQHNLEVIFLGGESRPIFCGNFKLLCHRLLTTPLVAILEKIFRLIFFPGARVTLMSPNIVAILKKSTDLSSVD